MNFFFLSNDWDRPRGTMKVFETQIIKTLKLNHDLCHKIVICDGKGENYASNYRLRVKTDFEIMKMFIKVYTKRFDDFCFYEPPN